MHFGDAVSWHLAAAAAAGQNKFKLNSEVLRSGTCASAPLWHRRDVLWVFNRGRKMSLLRWLYLKWKCSSWRVLSEKRGGSWEMIMRELLMVPERLTPVGLWDIVVPMFLRGTVSDNGWSGMGFWKFYQYLKHGWWNLLESTSRHS